MTAAPAESAEPVETATTAAEAEPVAEESAEPTIGRWGDEFTYDDDLVVKISKPEKFEVTDSAAPLPPRAWTCAGR